MKEALKGFAFGFFVVGGLALVLGLAVHAVFPLYSIAAAVGCGLGAGLGNGCFYAIWYAWRASRRAA